MFAGFRNFLRIFRLLSHLWSAPPCRLSPAWFVPSGSGVTFGPVKSGTSVDVEMIDAGRIVWKKLKPCPIWSCVALLDRRLGRGVAETVAKTIQTNPSHRKLPHTKSRR